MGRLGSGWARVVRCAACAVALAAAPASAVTPEEFAAMEPEAALALPVTQALQVFGWREQEFMFVLENTLLDLRYLYRAPSGRASAQLTAAVKAFQRDTAREPTGVLLVSEFMDMAQRGNEFWQAPIYPGPAAVARSGEVITATGTWAAAGVTEPDPIQTTSIRCHPAVGVCSMATARVLMADEANGWFHAAAADLTLTQRDWRITESGADRIVARDDDGPCVAYTLTIELAAQSATMDARPLPGEQCRSAAQPPRTYRLTHGYQVATRYWEERQARLHKLRSSAFQKLVEKVQGKR
jgi:hypothetical protein